MPNLHDLKHTLPVVMFFLLAACGDDSPNSADPSSNTTPVIQGTPSTTAVVGDTYEFVPTANDPDDDLLTFEIENRPGWATFSPTTGRLSGRPPAATAARVYPDIRISVTDSQATASLPEFDLEVEADPDAPPNTAPSISGSPTTTVIVGNAYSFTPQADDPDGQVLTFSVSNLPAWAEFDALSGSLAGTPGVDDLGTFAGIVISVSDGVESDALPSFDITVSAGTPPPPDNHAPSISGTPSQAVTAGQAYSFRPTASDPDGQALSFAISGQPSWANFSAATGRLSGTPAASDAGSFSNIVISVSDGAASTSLPGFSITVIPANAAPQISGTPPSTVTAGQPYEFQPSATDPDGQSLTFSISNKPGWASFSTQSGRLSGTPASNQVGSYNNVRISVSDGATTSSLPAFSIRVDSANRPPVISGNPATSATIGVAYDFTPGASDPDGDTLTFAIVNKPSWASFNTASGRLSGTPTNAGNFGGIQVSVSDGTATAALTAFAINVSATNRAPVIGGSPTLSVSVGQGYDFRPTASDPDGNSLSFTIQGQPSWASFDPASGRLSGTPDAGDAGSYTGIRITVSDGTASASLPSFTIAVQQVQLGSVTLSWTAPTQNEDGTPLTNLDGYRIYYGQNASALSTIIEIPNAGITSAMVEDLSPATWYFAIKAYTTDGVESSFSNVASKRID